MASIFPEMVRTSAANSPKCTFDELPSTSPPRTPGRSFTQQQLSQTGFKQTTVEVESDEDIFSSWWYKSDLSNADITITPSAYKGESKSVLIEDLTVSSDSDSDDLVEVTNIGSTPLNYSSLPGNTFAQIICKTEPKDEYTTDDIKPKVEPEELDALLPSIKIESSIQPPPTMYIKKEVVDYDDQAVHKERMHCQQNVRIKEEVYDSLLSLNKSQQQAHAKSSRSMQKIAQVPLLQPPDHKPVMARNQVNYLSSGLNHPPNILNSKKSLKHQRAKEVPPTKQIPPWNPQPANSDASRESLSILASAQSKPNIPCNFKIPKRIPTNESLIKVEVKSEPYDPSDHAMPVTSNKVPPKPRLNTKNSFLNTMKMVPMNVNNVVRYKDAGGYKKSKIQPRGSNRGRFSKLILSKADGLYTRVTFIVPYRVEVVDTDNECDYEEDKHSIPKTLPPPEIKVKPPRKPYKKRSPKLTKTGGAKELNPANSKPFKRKGG